MEGLPTSEFSKHLRTIEYNGARATVDIDDTNATVFIQHLEAAEPGQGAGSQLLNKLKTDFPEYIIEGTAMPLDFDNPFEEPTEQEIEQAMMLEAESDFRQLSDEERERIRRVREQHKKSSSFDPVMRLLAFYKDNHFAVESDGHFVSKPPHRIKE